MRIESFNFDPALASKGCFPYSNDYPFTHSLLGMAIAGLHHYHAYLVFPADFKGRACICRDLYSVDGPQGDAPGPGSHPTHRAIPFLSGTASSP
jgi:hypothetical protein